MSLLYLLMGAQAGGNLVDMFSTSSQIKMARRAAEMEGQQLDLRMQQERLASTERSVFQLEQLNETLASQRALMAARGGTPGVGSALALEQKSIQSFKRDEEARELSLGFMESQIKSQQVVGKMSAAGTAAQLGAGLMSRTFKQVPFSQMMAGDGSKTPKKSGGVKPMKGAKSTRRGSVT
jgi:hypothetical protein